MSPAIMYLLYGLMAMAALFICLGLFYRVATVIFFLIFCYAELLDKTYYLNHYYLVTIRFLSADMGSGEPLFLPGCFEKTNFDGYTSAILDYPDFQIPAPDNLLLCGFIQAHE